MLQFLIALDHRLFALINGFPHTPFLDAFFSFFSGIGSWGLVWIAIGIVLMVWEEIKDKRELFALFTGVAISFITVEIILKNLIGRLRPEFSLPVIVLDAGFNSFSFPSGHTTVAFASAYILSAKHRKLKFFYYLLAALISFSRIYLGKHYPSDVIAGIFLGILIGYLSIKINKPYSKKYNIEKMF